MLLTILTLTLLKHAGPLGFQVEVSAGIQAHGLYRPNHLHKYYAKLKAMPKCLIILQLCVHLPNQVLPIIYARVDVPLGKNHYMEKLDQCLDLTACHSKNFIKTFKHISI